MEEIKIRDEFIKLGQLLKLADMVQDGVEAKYVITDGLVKVNGEVDDVVAERFMKVTSFLMMEKKLK